MRILGRNGLKRYKKAKKLVLYRYNYGSDQYLTDRQIKTGHP